jgi:RNA polymerase sigma factor (sigma-70 family)
MPTARLAPFLKRLRSTAFGEAASLTDRELLERFAACRDETAFAALVRRHGGMVLAVCRRLLRDWHAAQDAFQATFLVLARKSNTLAEPDLLPGWLHSVAWRTAVRARADAARRRARESRVEPQRSIAPDEALLWRDLRPVLDEEIARLPGRQGAAVVLCYLEGRTNAEAARRLDCSRGTVATLLARARERLRRRLARRGLSLPVGLAAALAGTGHAGGVPGVLESSTVRAACAFAAHGVETAGPASAWAVSLAEGVTRTMMVKKLTVVAIILLVVGLGGAGVGLAAYRAAAEEPAAARPVPVARAPQAAEPPEAARPVARGRYRTANSLVNAPNWDAAERIAQEAERQRKALALLWLGRELPDWSQPCPVLVKIAGRGSRGRSVMQFKAGKLAQLEMLLEGPLDRILRNYLPHEVTHAILADWFGSGLPRWADEGAAIMAESAAARSREERVLWQVLDEDRLIPLSRLLALRDYPVDAEALHAQGHSLTGFLVSKGGHRCFLTFVREGERHGWGKVVRDFYGYRSVDELQVAWLTAVREARRKSAAVAQPPQPSGPARPPVPPAAPSIPLEAVKPGLHLPLGPAPVQALVTLTNEGGLGIWNQRTTFHTVTTFTRQGQPVTTYRAVSIWELERHDRRDVRVYDTRGKELSAKEWRRLVKGETLALVAVDGRPVDPLHFRVIKEGTLLFVLPPRPAAVVPATPPLGVVPPGAPPVGPLPPPVPAPAAPEPARPLPTQITPAPTTGPAAPAPATVPAPVPPPSVDPETSLVPGV